MGDDDLFMTPAEQDILGNRIEAGSESEEEEEEHSSSSGCEPDMVCGNGNVIFSGP